MFDIVIYYVFVVCNLLKKDVKNERFNELNELMK